MNNKSVSSCCKTFLSEQQLGYTFTTDSFTDAMIATGRWPDVQFTQGAVSGFCSRAIDIACLTYSDEGQVRHFVYTSDISIIRVKNAPGIGSSPGKSGGERHTRRRPTVASLAERLFEIAADIERLQPALPSVSTKDLLEELQRRTEKQVV